MFHPQASAYVILSNDIATARALSLECQVTTLLLLSPSFLRFELPALLVFVDLQVFQKCGVLSENL